MRVLTLLSLLLLLVITGSEVKASGGSTPFYTFGYLPEYRLNGFNYSAAFRSGLTHLLFFSIEVAPDGSLTALDRVPGPAALKSARRAADAAGGGKLLMSLGGNARSNNFGPMALSASKRRHFLQELDALLRRGEMDGVDYNWEYPRNDREWRAWAELLRESKVQLLDGRATVTFTIYLDPAHFDKIQRYDLLRHADFVLCMAYDARDRHSTVEFYQSGFDLAERFKLPRSKFINGLPFYGRDRRTGDPKTYAEIAPAAVKALGKARVLELEPYRPDRDEVALGQGVQYYNSRATIYHKTRMALEQGYGGVMIWEIGQDAQPLDRRGSLMRALQSAIPAERRLPALATPANPTPDADL